MKSKKKKFNWKDKLTEANYAKKLFWFMRKSKTGF